ncbi:MAG: autoinducer binding domain-containing protein [Deltaproteobacteria bacterium]|nr:autoinducer binding domain-containing protein [Deltaproteobacteria bacterium]
MINSFSKNDLVNIMEIIESSMQCSSEAGVKTLLRKTSGLVGAEFSICGKGTLLLSDIAIINGSYPAAWVDDYKKEKLYLHDPIVSYHLRFTRTFGWEDALREDMGKMAKKIVSRAQDYGIRHGLSTGIFDPVSQRLSLFSFVDRKRIGGAREKTMLDYLSPHLHSTLLRICGNTNEDPHDLLAIQ